MSTPKTEPPFFVGWAPAPMRSWAFLASVASALICLFAFAGYLVAATQTDPGDGAFMGRAAAIGVIEAEPYPMLHVTESERFETGETIILSGGGKRGVQERAGALDGQLVEIFGQRLSRGDLAGMQLAGGQRGLKPAETGTGTPPEPIPLGRWRVAGEICDGKCYIGAMRPGRGLAHKACANLCISGGVPPVFVATDKIDGTEFLLLADAEGGPVTEALLDYTAVFVEIEGEVERRGGLLVFKIDPETITVIP